MDRSQGIRIDVFHCCVARASGCRHCCHHCALPCAALATIEAAQSWRVLQLWLWWRGGYCIVLSLLVGTTRLLWSRYTWLAACPLESMLTFCSKILIWPLHNSFAYDIDWIENIICLFGLKIYSILCFSSISSLMNRMLIFITTLELTAWEQNFVS